jgi:hypothetical protein
MSNVVEFVWRNLVASYDLDKKEFTFYQDSMYIVPWEEYPEDMVKFINWITTCQQHKDGVIWTTYATGEKQYPEPKTVKMY